MGGLITRREERADYQPVPQLPSEVINFYGFFLQNITQEIRLTPDKELPQVTFAYSDAENCRL